MTREEVNTLLALMKVNYSNAFRGMSRQERMLLLKTWTITLQDLDASVVMIAVMQLISESKWMPSVAEIREKCRALHFDAMSAQYSPYWQNMPEREKAAYETIVAKTEHLRGNEGAGLSIDAIIAGRQGIDMLNGTERQAWIESDERGNDDP